MSVSSERKKQLRSLGHNLKPVVTVAGNGLNENVLAEIDRALNDHELIKIKLAVEDREDRLALTNDIVTELNAEVVQTIGKIVLLLREAKKPNLKLSNLRR